MAVGSVFCGEEFVECCDCLVEGGSFCGVGVEAVADEVVDSGWDGFVFEGVDFLVSGWEGVYEGGVDS